MIRIANLTAALPRASGPELPLDTELQSRLGIRINSQALLSVSRDALSDIQVTDEADSVAIVVGSLCPEMVVPPHHEVIKLRELVSQLLDRRPAEAGLMIALANVLGATESSSVGGLRSLLLDCIREDRLHALFYQGGDVQSGGICLAGLNSRSGDVDPAAMAAWRATYRALAPEQQMMAATIVWLNQSGPDSTWLRRVPCTWGAVEAIRYMKDAGALARWLRLVALYPGR
jgi:hypothetical protein